MSSLFDAPLQAAKEIGGDFLDLLFPPRCLTCDRLAPAFCDACREQIVEVEEGAPIPSGIADVRSVGYHEGPLRKAVVRLTFQHRTALARPLGELLAGQLASVMESWQPDLLAPVPIHWTRDWERGFNQAELLAEAASRHSLIPMERVLRRTRRTRPQVGLARESRATNLHGAFALDPRSDVKGRWVVLVDDVRTTGATLSECAAVLRAAGAAEVFALTVTFDR